MLWLDPTISQCRMIHRPEFRFCIVLVRRKEVRVQMRRRKHRRNRAGRRSKGNRFTRTETSRERRIGGIRALARTCSGWISAVTNAGGRARNHSTRHGKLSTLPKYPNDAAYEIETREFDSPSRRYLAVVLIILGTSAWWIYVTDELSRLVFDPPLTRVSMHE